MAQLPPGLSQAELRQRLQESKPDSNRILLLHALGRTYLKEEYSDTRASSIDTAIGIFKHAGRLSDTLQLKRFGLRAGYWKGMLISLSEKRRRA